MATRATFKALLKKKTFSVDELGRLIFAYNIFGSKRMLQGKIPFTAAELTAKMDALADNDKAAQRVFGLYIELSQTFQRMAKNIGWLGQLGIVAVGEVKKFTLMIAQQLNAHWNECLQPITVTESEYEEAIERSKARNASKDPCPALGDGLEGLYKLGIEYYLDLLDKDPEAENPLKELKERYQAETLTDERLLSFYREFGTNPELVSYDNKKGKPWTEEEMARRLAQRYPCYTCTPNIMERSLLLAKCKALLHHRHGYGLAARTLEKYLAESVSVELKRPPSKWDLLQARPFFPEAFKCFGNYEGEGWQDEYAKDLEYFMQTYEDMVDYILKECYVGGVCVCKDVDMYKHLDKRLSGKDYWAMDKYGFRQKYVTGAAALFPDDLRGENGLAVIKEGKKPAPFQGFKATLIYSPSSSSYAEVTEAVKTAVDVAHALSCWAYVVAIIEGETGVGWMDSFKLTPILKLLQESISSWRAGVGMTETFSNMPGIGGEEFDAEFQEVEDLYRDVFSYLNSRPCALEPQESLHIDQALEGLPSLAANLEATVQKFIPRKFGGKQNDKASR